ncbi:MAG: hypothetical protein HDR17_16425 [Lachnospiraceae bacterium]|nr:hypothetical protein [Lachnospiraceae bacterium]
METLNLFDAVVIKEFLKELCENYIFDKYRLIFYNETYIFFVKNVIGGSYYVVSGQSKYKFAGFKKNGLKNVDMTAFSRRNLIIGKNGSGKTRFFKVLEQEKKQDKTKKETVITLYFPEIQAFYNSG